MQSINSTSNIQSAEYLAEREAVKKTMHKMQQELKKPEVLEVFMRLKDK